MSERDQKIFEDLGMNLRDWLDQARAYQRVLRDPRAQAALDHLADLAERIRNDVRELNERVAPVEPGPRSSPLTPRETMILQLVAGGFGNKEVAYRLSISDRTVQFHLKSVFEKTGTSTRTEVAVKAIRCGWIKND
jgi:DNA-binding NarL/FixJ family response regulator